jgi:hypothetical protein
MGKIGRTKRQKTIEVRRFEHESYRAGIFKLREIGKKEGETWITQKPLNIPG